MWGVRPLTWCSYTTIRLWCTHSFAFFSSGNTLIEIWQQKAITLLNQIVIPVAFIWSTPGDQIKVEYTSSMLNQTVMRVNVWLSSWDESLLHLISHATTPSSWCKLDVNVDKEAAFRWRPVHDDVTCLVVLVLFWEQARLLNPSPGLAPMASEAEL